MRSLLIPSLGRLLLLALLLAGAACDDDPLTPEERVSGDYRATTLLVVDGGTTLDALGIGAELDLTLRPDGTTAGRFFVPGGDDDGSDLDADLTGTFTLSDDGQVVRLDHAADTFLRDIDLMVQGDRLVSAQGGIQLVLTRR